MDFTFSRSAAVDFAFEASPCLGMISNAPVGTRPSDSSVDSLESVSNDRDGYVVDRMKAAMPAFSSTKS